MSRHRAPYHELSNTITELRKVVTVLQLVVHRQDFLIALLRRDQMLAKAKPKPERESKAVGS